MMSREIDVIIGFVTASGSVNEALFFAASEFPSMTPSSSSLPRLRIVTPLLDGAAATTVAALPLEHVVLLLLLGVKC